MSDDILKLLESLGLDKYADVFAANEIDNGVLPYLDDSDLKELGLPMGPRKKLLAAIAELGRLTSAGTEPALPEPQAERRQVTVMFCDLVGSTALSARLDPEDLRQVILAYQSAVAGAIARMDGHVARFMGDGVLAYFGYPQAHEDDAERAIRAGLECVNAVASQNVLSESSMAARVGIATGLVVVGDLIGRGANQEHAIVGETPNLAARLQGVAQPGEVVIARETRGLIGALFDLEASGPHDLKGIADPVEAFVVLGNRAIESRFEAHLVGGPAAMVGRDQELALIMERWQQARSGEGQVVLLSGEAGIGKSRISRAVIDAVAQQPHVRISCQCSPYHVDSALYPVTQQLERMTALAPGDGPDDRLSKLEEVLARAFDDPAEAAPLFAALLGIAAEHRYGKLDLSPGEQRRLTLEALVAHLTGLARRQPLLFVMEDAHWVDPSTLEFIDLCLDRIAYARILLLITARPTFEHAFGGHPIVSRLMLNRLGQAHITSVIEHVTGGKQLPEPLLREIVAKCDGVPLFIEELTKTVLESGALRETAEGYVLDERHRGLVIPSSLNDSLMARLDRLQSVKEVAQAAACIGREFDYRLLAAACPIEQAALLDALDRLVAAELVFRWGMPPEARYTFKHALVRDAAYESLLKTKRRALHDRLLSALETQVAPPEILAYHATEAEQLEKAIDYWQQAGEASVARPAYQEAIAHFENAIQLTQRMGEERHWQEKELDLQVKLAQALVPKHGQGSAEAARAFQRASELMRATGNTALRVPVVYGSWTGHFMRAEHRACHRISLGLVEEVDRAGDDASRVAAHRLHATTLFSLGRPREAQAHLELSLSAYRRDMRAELTKHFVELSVQVRSYLIQCLWMLGYPDQASRVATETLKLANEIDHANTRLYLDCQLFCFYTCGRQESAAQSTIRHALDLASRYGMVFYSVWAELGSALCDARSGDTAALEALEALFERYAAMGIVAWVPMFRCEHAKALLSHNKPARAERIATQALDTVERTNERWMEAELNRVLGDIHLTNDDPERAEMRYRRAMDVASRQAAKGWELRAAAGLAGLWRSQGKIEAAHNLLDPVHDWFTEGFDSPDLRDAKTLLETLA